MTWNVRGKCSVIASIRSTVHCTKISENRRVTRIVVRFEIPPCQQAPWAAAGCCSCQPVRLPHRFLFVCTCVRAPPPCSATPARSAPPAQAPGSRCSYLRRAYDARGRRLAVPRHKNYPRGHTRARRTPSPPVVHSRPTPCPAVVRSRPTTSPPVMQPRLRSRRGKRHDQRRRRATSRRRGQRRDHSSRHEHGARALALPPKVAEPLGMGRPVSLPCPHRRYRRGSAAGLAPGPVASPSSPSCTLRAMCALTSPFPQHHPRVLATMCSPVPCATHLIISQHMPTYNLSSQSLCMPSTEPRVVQNTSPTQNAGVLTRPAG